MQAVTLGILALAITVVLLIWWFKTHLWHPKPKQWCAMFYLVSQVHDAVDFPDEETGTRLDSQLDQVVNTIRALPCATAQGVSDYPTWDDVYVVYRAIWDGADRLPEARVVRPERFAPAIHLFPGQRPTDVSLTFDLSDDVERFFAWAYKKCPAEHYAVFFWGHSMGPGGLFHLAEPPIVVAPPMMLALSCVRWLFKINRWSGIIGLTGLREALEPFVERRLAEQTRPIRSARLPTGARPAVAPPPSPKVEIVLFQDCWMSSLETAFELQSTVRYIIASQSLVPIGLNEIPGQPGVTWCYRELIEALFQPNYAPAMLGLLRNFFDQGGANIYPNTKVLFTLLDCGVGQQDVTNNLAQRYRALVGALEYLGPDGRSGLIDHADGTAGRFYEFSGGQLVAGDADLIDVLTMCDYLRTPAEWIPEIDPSAARSVIENAAAVLRTAIDSTLIVSGSGLVNPFQSPPGVAQVPNYRGVTVLYKTWTPPPNDRFIDQTLRPSYDALRFAQDAVFLAAVPGVSEEISWAAYAFEQYPWSDNGSFGFW